MISDVLEDPSILSSLYSVLFNLLDMTTLRADLCPLLAQITRRKHVRPFRIQMLQDLSQSVGREPALSKLMQIYDNYAPGILDVKKATEPVSTFSHPDPEWANQLLMILERADHLPTDPLHPREATTSLRRGAKRIRLSASVEGSYSLDRIQNADDLVNNIEKIRITGLASSDLDDPVLQRYLMLASEDTYTEDVNECLSKAFMQQLDSFTSGRDAKKPLAEVLEEALAYTRYTKTLPKAEVSFLEDFLQRLLPPQQQEMILDLLSYFPLEPFSGTSLIPDSKDLLTNRRPPSHSPGPPRNGPHQYRNYHRSPPHPPKILHNALHALEHPSPLRIHPTNTHPSGHPPRPDQAHNATNANPPNHIPHRHHNLPNTNAPLNPPTPGRTAPVDPPPTTTAINDIPNHLHVTIALNPITSLLATHQLEKSLREQQQYCTGSSAD